MCLGERERIRRSWSVPAVCSSAMAGILMTRALCSGVPDLERDERVCVWDTAFRRHITTSIQVIFSEYQRRSISEGRTESSRVWERFRFDCGENLIELYRSFPPAFKCRRCRMRLWSQTHQIRKTKDASGTVFTHSSVIKFQFTPPGCDILWCFMSVKNFTRTNREPHNYRIYMMKFQVIIKNTNIFMDLTPQTLSLEHILHH